MADNAVVANPGVGGATFASDQIAGIEYPRSKIVWGADGIAGDTSVANPLPVVQTGTPGLPTGAATEATLDARTGSLTEAAPATDTASSGLNGRLQRVAQRLTSLIALVPAALSGLGNFKVSLADIVGTAADVNSGNKSAGTLRVVLATDQPALTNKLLVTPDSVALPANQSVNVAQLVGTATDVNSGNKSAGTLRVVLATDQPALTNKLLVTPDSVALPANQSVNQAQIAGTATSVNSGTKDAGTQRVVIATDQPALTTPLPTKETRSATATTSQVADNAASVTILASNANRLGATIQNDSTATLYVKFGTTASLTDYTVQIVTNAYYEVPFGYTGRIDGIWATDPNTGSARVTELTA